MNWFQSKSTPVATAQQAALYGTGEMVAAELGSKNHIIAEEIASSKTTAPSANTNALGETLSSLPQASFNYINSIVGSGVIGIPYAFHRAGFGLGFLLLILVAYITDYSLILMVSGS